MYFRNAYKKLRKHWVLTNFFFGALFMFGFVSLLITLTEPDMGSIHPLLSILLMVPVMVFGIDIDMVLTPKEGMKIIFALLLSYYALLTVLEVYDSQSILSLFTIEMLKTYLAATVIFVFLFTVIGFLLLFVLFKKNRKHPRKYWKMEDGINAAYYVYRKLPKSTIQNTTLEELETLLLVHNPIQLKDDGKENAVKFYSEQLQAGSTLTAEHIEQIVQLRDEYKHHRNIVLQKG